jgi:hypothetical protein
VKTLLAMSVILAAACGAGAEITTNRDKSVPVPAEPTWAWGRKDTVSHYELDPAAENMDLHRLVQESIESALAGKHWKKVDPDQAQLLVTYHIGIRRGTDYQTTTTGMGGGWYGGYGWGYYGAPTYVVVTEHPINYTQGALLMVVRDRASNLVAWNGLYKKDVHEGARPTRETIQGVVNDLLRDFR